MSNTCDDNPIGGDLAGRQLFPIADGPIRAVVGGTAADVAAVHAAAQAHLDGWFASIAEENRLHTAQDAEKCLRNLPASYTDDPHATVSVADGEVAVRDGHGNEVMVWRHGDAPYLDRAVELLQPTLGPSFTLSC